jgi:hypothetical protein
MTTVSRRTVAMVGSLLTVAAVLAAPVPERKEPPEPDWMKAFRTAYELKDGEFVRRVAPPYIPERIDFKLHPLSGKEDVDARNRADAVKNGRFYTVFVEQDGKKLTRRMVLSSVYLAGQPQLQQGDNLLTVWDAVTLITGRESPEVVIDPKAKDDPVFAPKNKTVSGDFVTRKAAPLAKLAPQLDKIFREECQLDVTLTVKEEEQEVFVVGGKFKLAPPEWRGDAKNAIGLQMLDVYATDDGLNKEFDHFDFEKGRAGRQAVQSMGYSGTPVELVRFLGDRVKTRMVWDADLPAEPKFMWHNHTFKNPTKEQEAEDKDPEKVLPNVAAQTGLTFKKEKRKVPVLYVSVPEKK